MITTVFQPIVHLTPKPEGGYTMTVDWSSSIIGVIDDGNSDVDTSDAEQLASEAMDAWILKQPTNYIVPRPPTEQTP